MNMPISPITDPDTLTSKAISLHPGELSISVRAQPVEASYELSKSRGNRARGLELLDKLDTHFQTTA